MTEATLALRPTYRDTVAARANTPLIVAHRGAWPATCENTVAAIDAAASAGYEIVEIDIRQTADGALVLFHDDTLARMAGADTTIEALNLAELKAIPLRPADGRGDKAPGDWRVPTLQEALEAARDRAFLDLDLKNLALLEVVAPAVASMGMTGQVDLKIPVSSPDDVALLHDLERRYGIMVMPKIRFEDETADAMIDLLRQTGAVICETAFDRLDTLKSRSDALRATGATLWVNTLDPVSHDGLTDSAAAIDPDAIWGSMLAAGVGAIQTDLPGELKAWRARRAGASS